MGGGLAKGKGVLLTFSAVNTGQNEISGGEFGQCLEDGEIQTGSKCFLKK